MTKLAPSFFTTEELALLHKDKIPNHVAIIPDGNRRWSTKSLWKGELHSKGADVVTDIVQGAKQMGIKTVTIFTFSTENWRRPQYEIDSHMNLLCNYVIKQKQSMIQEGIRLETIGNLEKLPLAVQKIVDEGKEATKGGEELTFILALNYGGKDDLLRAMKKMALAYKKGTIDLADFTEQEVNSHLDTAKFGDPDLLIRTSGEMRISNFLLWQSSYTELFFSPVLWPDFTPKHLLGAVLDYQKRQKRMGS